MRNWGAASCRLVSGLGRLMFKPLFLSSMLAVAVAASAGCASGSGTGGGYLSVAVGPQQSLFDTPLSIQVTGAQPGSRVAITVSSTDSKGVLWASLTVFVASPSGSVNPAQDKAVSGSYTGRDPMGPIEFMAAKRGNDSAYFWSRQPQTFKITASSGSATASATVDRLGLSEGVQFTNETIAAAGFVGQYWAPASPSRHAAVLEFGGSEGGLDGQLAGALLASHGYPTLDIAYFGEPDLPAHLKNVPLEYFATALRWLAARPQVDPQHIWVSGVSRGSEAALLLGANYPTLVHGVIASVPSNVALCGLPDCSGPAWTLNGNPVPYTSQIDDPHPTDNPQAIISVNRIRGPILLDCGGVDTVWTSCAYAQAITAELTAARDPRPHILLSYPNAGHGVGELVPYEPSSQSSPDPLNRATSLADRMARADLWPKLLAFLAS